MKNRKGDIYVLCGCIYELVSIKSKMKSQQLPASDQTEKVNQITIKNE